MKDFEPDAINADKFVVWTAVAVFVFLIWVAI